MEQYAKEKKLGEGSYGIVWRAIDKKSGEYVAVKELKEKFVHLDECRNSREVKSLRKLYNHPNIVKLLNLVKVHNKVFMVFEYMESDLHQLMKQRDRIFSETEVRDLFFQVLQGLQYMHHRGYFHRDLKPSNLLVSKKNNVNVIKVADLGMAREIDSPIPCTQDVTTLWYRAPEVLLHSAYYGPEVDMWAMGAILFEMLSFMILFPGTTSLDQLYRICHVIGSPTQDSWPDGIRLARSNPWGNFPLMEGLNLHHLLPSASKDAIDLISRLCSWDPRRRLTAAAALGHPFFRGCFGTVPQLVPQFHYNYKIEATTVLRNNNTTVMKQGYSMTYSTHKELNDDQQSGCSCLKCDEKQRMSTNNDPVIIKPVHPTTLYNMPYNIASGMQPFLQPMMMMMSRPPGF